MLDSLRSGLTESPSEKDSWGDEGQREVWHTGTRLGELGGVAAMGGQLRCWVRPGSVAVIATIAGIEGLR